MTNYDCEPANFFAVNRHAFEGAMRRGIEVALLAHKRAGVPIAVWRNNQIVLVPPEEIAVNDPVRQRDLKSPEDC